MSNWKVVVSHVPALRDGQKTISSAWLQFTSEIGDSGLGNSEFAWSPVTRNFKVGESIEVPAGATPVFYDRESVDEETGEVVKFRWVRWEMK